MRIFDRKKNSKTAPVSSPALSTAASTNAGMKIQPSVSHQSAWAPIFRPNPLYLSHPNALQLKQADSLSSTVPNENGLEGPDHKKILEKPNKLFSPLAIHRLASQGVQGPSQKLPHLNRLQPAFGKHDLGQVQAYIGPRARNAAQAIGAKAYATGNKIAFAEPNPDIHTVAHEATHVIQQRAGVHLKSNIGQLGDIYEQEADQVANKIVQGKSAAALLANYNKLTENSSYSQPSIVSGYPVQMMKYGYKSITYDTKFPNQDGHPHISGIYGQIKDDLTELNKLDQQLTAVIRSYDGTMEAVPDHEINASRQVGSFIRMKKFISSNISGSIGTSNGSLEESAKKQKMEQESEQKSKKQKLVQQDEIHIPVNTTITNQVEKNLEWFYQADEDKVLVKLIQKILYVEKLNTQSQELNELFLIVSELERKPRPNVSPKFIETFSNISRDVKSKYEKFKIQHQEPKNDEGKDITTTNKLSSSTSIMESNQTITLSKNEKESLELLLHILNDSKYQEGPFVLQDILSRQEKTKFNITLTNLIQILIEQKLYPNKIKLYCDAIISILNGDRERANSMIPWLQEDQGDVIAAAILEIFQLVTQSTIEEPIHAINTNFMTVDQSIGSSDITDNDQTITLSSDEIEIINALRSIIEESNFENGFKLLSHIASINNKTLLIDALNQVITAYLTGDLNGISVKLIYDATNHILTGYKKANISGAIQLVLETAIQLTREEPIPTVNTNSIDNNQTSFSNETDITNTQKLIQAEKTRVNVSTSSSNLPAITVPELKEAWPYFRTFQMEGNRIIACNAHYVKPFTLQLNGEGGVLDLFKFEAQDYIKFINTRLPHIYTPDQKSEKTAYLPVVTTPLTTKGDSLGADKKPEQLQEIYQEGLAEEIKPRIKLLVAVNANGDDLSNPLDPEVQLEEKIQSCSSLANQPFQTIVTGFTFGAINKITMKGSDKSVKPNLVRKLLAHAGDEGRKLLKPRIPKSQFPFGKVRDHLIFQWPGKDIYDTLQAKYSKVFYHFGDADIISFKANINNESIFQNFDDIQQQPGNEGLVRAGGNYRFNKADILESIREKASARDEKSQAKYPKLAELGEHEISLLTELVSISNWLDMEAREVWDRVYRQEGYIPPVWYSEANIFLRGDFIHHPEVSKIYKERADVSQGEKKEELHGMFPDIHVPLYETLIKSKVLGSSITSLMDKSLSLITAARNDIRDKKEDFYRDESKVIQEAPMVKGLKDILSNTNKEAIILELARFPLAHHLHDPERDPNTQKPLKSKPNNNQFRLMAMNQMLSVASHKNVSDRTYHGSLSSNSYPKFYEDFIKAQELYHDLYALLRSGNDYEYNYIPEHAQAEKNYESYKSKITSPNSKLLDTVLKSLNDLTKVYLGKVTEAYKDYLSRKDSQNV